ncbi:MAG: DUF1036 domain-containing protein [Shimia sp.]
MLNRVDNREGKRSSQSFAVRTALILGFALGVGVPRAHANFQVCNQTLDVINVAIGAYDVDAWETRGWWTIGPNQCGDVIREELTSRFVYVYARDVFNNSMLEGTTPMCVEPGEFILRGRENCLLNGYLTARFVEVDTRRSERWTFFLQAARD